MQNKISTIIAESLLECGTSVITHVPGFGATQVFQEINKIVNNKYSISYNEEVAYTISHSAAIVGKRSAAVFKTHGLYKAANSVIDSLYTELTVGFVILLFDDKDGSHSDNIIDYEAFLKGLSIPYNISNHEDISCEINSAYKKSEQSGLPFVIVFDSEIVDEQRENQIISDFEERTYKRDVLKHIIHPAVAEYQYKNLQYRIGRVPKKPKKADLPTMPDELPQKSLKHALLYKPFFETFKNVKRDLTTGDTTLSSAYSFPPYNAIDIITYIGGSIPLAIGSYLAGNLNVWALSGDFGFLAAGHMGLLEAIERNIPLKLVIFNNKIAASTGGQPVNQKILNNILAPYKDFVTLISGNDSTKSLLNQLNDMNMSDTLSILVLEYN